MFDFDISNGYVALRIICGLFFIPHAIGKVTMREGVHGFFNAAGMKPAPLFALFGLVTETIVAICLILGVFTAYAAAVGAVFLFVAFLAVLKVSNRKWLWNLGGAEYPLFWGFCCAIVALHAS